MIIDGKILFFFTYKKYFDYFTYNILYKYWLWINYTNTNLTYSTNTKTNLSISIAYLEERTEETDIKTTDISLHDQMGISVYRV